ncbi:MAG: hypothetical protein AAF467_07970 [Actinomycetota bacterium]
MSLDLFGTALRQPLLEPDDIHLLVGSTLERCDGGQRHGYPELRQAAEQAARDADAGRDEIGLAQVADQLTTLLGAAGPGDLADAGDARALARRAISHELQLHHALSRAHPDATFIADLARERGFQVAYVADTPLPHDWVLRMLAQADLWPDHLLVSSQEGVRKHVGLFERLSEVTGFDPSAIVHLGPHDSLDVSEPMALGYQAIRHPHPIEQTNLGSLYCSRTRTEAHNSRTAADSMLLSLVQDRLGPHPEYPRTLTDLGYGAAGPFVVGLAAWIARLIDDLHPQLTMIDGPLAPSMRMALGVIRPDLPDVATTDPGNDLAGDLLRISAYEDRRVLAIGTDLHRAWPRELRHAAAARSLGVDIVPAYLAAPQPRTDSPDVHYWCDRPWQRRQLQALSGNQRSLLATLCHAEPVEQRSPSGRLARTGSARSDVAAGLVDYAEDACTWLRLDFRHATSLLAEPMVRLLSEPTAEETVLLAQLARD